MQSRFTKKIDVENTLEGVFKWADDGMVILADAIEEIDKRGYDVSCAIGKDMGKLTKKLKRTRFALVAVIVGGGYVAIHNLWKRTKLEERVKALEEGGDK